MPVSLTQHLRDRRGEEVLHRLERLARRGGGVEHAMVCDHSEEFVEGGPEQGVRCRSSSQAREQGKRRFMVRRAAPMGVNQDVRIERDHPLSTIHELE